MAFGCISAIVSEREQILTERMNTSSYVILEPYLYRVPKMNLKNLIVIFVCLWVSACSVQKDFVAIGGSKADAVVEVGYQYDSVTEKPVIDNEQAHRVAMDRCVKWGYSDAETFGLEKETCANKKGPGCSGSDRIISIEYQCTN